MKKFFFFIFPLILFGTLFYWDKKCFQVEKVLSEFSYQNGWSSEEFSSDKVEGVREILKGKYRYLSRGRQCFVFESSNQKHVLKLIDHSRFRIAPWAMAIPLPPFFNQMRLQKLEKRKSRIPFFYGSFRIAYQVLKEESELVYVELSPSSLWDISISIIDEIGRERQISLKDVEWILQKKGERICPSIEMIYLQEGVEGVRQVFLSFLELLSKRCLKGVVDDDLNVAENIGWVGGKAFFIDIGRFFFDPFLFTKEGYEREMRKSTKFFKKWLEKKHPEWVSDFEEMLIEKINSYAVPLSA